MAPITYLARTVLPVILSNNFTVYSNGTMFVVSYTTGVDIPNNSVIKIVFTNSLQFINYVSVNLNNITLLNWTAI